MVVFVVLWTLSAGHSSSSRQVKALQRGWSLARRLKLRIDLTHILGDIRSAVLSLHRVRLCAAGYSEMLGWRTSNRLSILQASDPATRQGKQS